MNRLAEMVVTNLMSLMESKNEIKIDTPYNLIIICYDIMRTEYGGFVKNKFLGEKTFKRNIIIKIYIEYASALSVDTFGDIIISNYTDEIRLDDYENIESSEYEFTQAKPPEISEFERIIFPALLVLVSAGATILFFVIRSK